MDVCTYARARVCVQDVMQSASIVTFVCVREAKSSCVCVCLFVKTYTRR